MISLRTTVALLAVACVHSVFSQTPAPSPASELSDEQLQKLLFDMEEETCLTSEKDHKAVADAIRKHMHPKFVINLFGNAIPLPKVIDIVANHPNPPKSSHIHDRTFVREGDTVVITGLYDRTVEKDGVVTKIKNERFADIFVQVDGEWKFLYSTFERPLEAPVAHPGK